MVRSGGPGFLMKKPKCAPHIVQYVNYIQNRESGYFIQKNKENGYIYIYLNQEGRLS